MTTDCATLYICDTCGRQDNPEHPAGEQLWEAVSAALSQTPDAAVRAERVSCLSSCGRSCSAALTMPGKWSWLAGKLSPELAGDLIIWAEAYAASPRGTVLPSRRPASLRDVVTGRIPGQPAAADKKG